MNVILRKSEKGFADWTELPRFDVKVEYRGEGFSTCANMDEDFGNTIRHLEWGLLR